MFQNVFLKKGKNLYQTNRMVLLLFKDHFSYSISIIIILSCTNFFKEVYMIRFLKLFFFLLVLILCLCTPYYLTTQRTGALYPAKENCNVDFENISFNEAQAKYDFIGFVTISGASSNAFTEQMKADVTTKTCEMDDDVVCLNSSFDNTANYGGGAVFQMAVFRKKTAINNEKETKKPNSEI